MNITILSIGTRGDVQPFIALGLELQRSGHDLKIVTHATFEAWICRGDTIELEDYLALRVEQMLAQS